MDLKGGEPPDRFLLLLFNLQYSLSLNILFNQGGAINLLFILNTLAFSFQVHYIQSKTIFAYGIYLCLNGFATLTSDVIILQQGTWEPHCGSQSSS